MKLALPLVKLSLLRPFADELRSRGIEPDLAFELVGLSEEATHDPDLSMHVLVVHKFLEIAAQVAKDPHFCGRVGANLPLNGWDMLADAEEHAKTIGEYLSMFCAKASEQTSTGNVYLHIDGPIAEFGEKRNYTPLNPPSQGDAFMVAVSWAILHRALGTQLDPSMISLRVSDPSVLPPEFDLSHPFKGDWTGYSIRFPSSWLWMPFDPSTPPPEKLAQNEEGTSEFVWSFRQVLLTHVGRGPISATDCAKLVSMSPQKLKRHLAAVGTDFTTELDHVRQEYARGALKETERPIAEISEDLGYSNAGNFARAFRRANGQTPSEYRAEASN